MVVGADCSENLHASGAPGKTPKYLASIRYGLACNAAKTFLDRLQGQFTFDLHMCK